MHSEELMYIQNQDQFMDQFKNMILITHIQEVTLEVYHKQLLEN